MNRSIPGPWGNYCVLVLDDNDIFLSVECDLIQRIIGCGYAGTTLEEEAFEFAERHHPRLVLVDLDMPSPHGTASIARLRKILPNSKILAISMLKGDPVRRAAIASGADELIEKSDLPGAAFYTLLSEVALICDDGPQNKMSVVQEIKCA